MVESNNQLDAVAVLVGPSLELYHLIIPWMWWVTYELMGELNAVYFVPKTYVILV